MTYKLRAPNDTTSIIGDRHNKPFVWVILGTAYTDSESVASYARQKLYAVTEVPEIPADYLEQSARLDAFRIPLNTGSGDAADPEARYRFTGPDGSTQFDIRDIIAGRVTA